MSPIVDVAIIGAGPYGLSAAAHLAASGLQPAVFGKPMATWREGTPRGMRLKSEGFATSMSDPAGAMTLGAFCRDAGQPYADLDWPVPVETFCDYGEAFQTRLVPQLDKRSVRQMRRTPNGFLLSLEDNTTLEARTVVVAAGIAPYRHIPPALAGLPADQLSHSCETADYSRFAGRRVAVVGAGASAIDAAAALHRAGATVHLVSRRKAVTFYAAGRRKPLDFLLRPMTPLGPGWKKMLCVRAPDLFRLLPDATRVRLLKRYLGPAPGWHARADFEGKVAVLLSATVCAARSNATGIVLELDTPGGRQELQADHVIAATGYDLDVRRLPFLDAELLNALDVVGGAPRLSSRFASSVDGLYFVGTAAATTFGPYLRFVCGAGFAARRVCKDIVGRTARDASIAVRRDTRGTGDRPVPPLLAGLRGWLTAGPSRSSNPSGRAL